MDKIKTKRQLMIELRDRMAGQLVANEIDLIFFGERAKNPFGQTQEFAEARQRVTICKDVIKVTIHILEIIDKKLLEDKELNN